MRVAVCVDDFGGMLFNGRRQSRDRELVAHLLRIAPPGRLLISPFSADLFPAEAVTLAEDFLERAEKDDLCFAEDAPLLPHLSRIDELILYRWNRRYPRDVLLDVDPAAQGLRLLSRIELAGYSHETITEERYVR